MPALSCGTTADRRSPMSISRMSRGGDSAAKLVTRDEPLLHQYQRPRPCQATLVVITIATSMMKMVALMLPRCATRHRCGIQRYRGRAGPQIATLFERAA
jgi:hypothetical protein